MDYVKIRTVAKDHPRFLDAGEAACTLWAWAMLYAGEHETDGRVPRVAVLKCAWLSGHAKALRAAYKLVEVGLWGADADGFSIIGWEKQGNKTRVQLDVIREREREKKAGQRRRDSDAPPPMCPAGTPHGTPSGVLNSLSSSPSSGSSDLSRPESPSAGDHPCGSVVIDEDLRAWAVGAGAAEPSPSLLEDYELWIAEKGVAVADRREGFKRWLKREKNLRSRVPASARGSKQPLGGAAHEPWADPNRNDGFGEVGT